MSFDLGEYRAGAERFLSEVDREYYLHLAGHKVELEIERVYARHRPLFERDAVARLRELAAAAAGDEARRLRHLGLFALDGLLGEATKAQAAESARVEAELVVEEGPGARGVPYRQVAVEQANEDGAERRERLERARNALLTERLGPIHREALERAHALCGELGWRSYAEAYAELRRIDLRALARDADNLLAATDEAYAAAVDPQLERLGLPVLGRTRRSDVARFFRAADLDGAFPAQRLVESLAETLAGLGIDLARQRNVTLDVEPRPTKSPRAFCSTPRVPGEVYLVVAPVGGRDDFAALFHEAGHAEHYACTDVALPFEFRHLGDNAVTESFAFLLEHLTADSDWLARRLGVAGAEPVVAHARAAKLVMVRRYAAKIAYELELHGERPDLPAMPGRYSRLLGGATRIEWPRASWLSDVDPGFYVACYLRAWGLEAHWRRALRERFGERWHERSQAGEWLRSLWREGQRLDADELCERELGIALDLSALTAELVG